jgi:hypothetical protein
MPSIKRRLPINFKLVFPDTPFTIRELRKQRHDVSYIAAVKRVEKALKDGVLILLDKVPSRAKNATGRPQKVYAKVA